MTEVESHQPVQVPPVTDDDDDYYQDDAGLPNTPPLKPMKVTYQPSPTPPLAVPLPPVSPDSSPPGTPDSKGPHKQKVRPSQSDAVLIDFIGNFGHRDIARKAGNEPLASEEEGEDTTMNGTHVEFGEKAEAEMESIEKDGSDIEEAGEEKAAKEGVEKDDLSSVAARAMNVLQRNSPPTPTQTTPATKRTESIPDTPSTEDEPMEDVKPTIPSITATLVDAPRLDPPAEVTVKLEIKAPGELPPIRHNSPHSATINGNGGPITLPSISDQLGDISHIPEPVQPGNSPFAQSPPGPRPPPQFAAVQGHGSPPKSPNDFRRELPSPGRGAFYNFGPGSHRRPSQTDGHHYSSAGEYSGSSAETPSTDHSGATPAIDRMSIDGITNPQIGGFQCVYPGCTAQPFQTQVSSICLSRPEVSQTNARPVSVEFSCKCSFFK